MENDLIHELVGDGAYRRRLLELDDRFVLMPSVGAVAPCHLLLCPVSHVGSFAALDDADRRGAELAVTRVEALIRARWGTSIHLFEHGNGVNTASTRCSVEHAHLHFVVSSADVWGHVEPLLAWSEVGSAAESLAVANGMEYLRYRSPEDRWFVALTTAAVPSQFMRKAFVELDRSGQEWDWRLHPATERVAAMVHELAPPAQAGSSL